VRFYFPLWCSLWSWLGLLELFSSPLVDSATFR
jgi:hypothetical protein